MRRKTKYIKKDANHDAICEELRRQGVDIVELFDPVDAVARLGDFVAFLELKIEGHESRFTRPQLHFIANTKWPIAIIKNATEGLEVMRTRATLTQNQKDALAGFLTRDKGKVWWPSKIERILNT